MDIKIKIDRIQAKINTLKHELYMHEQHTEVHLEAESFKQIKTIKRNIEKAETKRLELLKEYYGNFNVTEQDKQDPRYNDEDPETGFTEHDNNVIVEALIVKVKTGDFDLLDVGAMLHVISIIAPCCEEHFKTFAQAAVNGAGVEKAQWDFEEAYFG